MDNGSSSPGPHHRRVLRDYTFVLLLFLMLDSTMRWFASSSSSSAPSSSSSPKKKGREEGGWLFRSRRKIAQQQRKLLNVGRDFDGAVSKCPNAPGSEAALGSPQPLPLPEEANRRGRRCSRCSSWGHENCMPFPAPR